jgi:hypothetical protein
VIGLLIVVDAEARRGLLKGKELYIKIDEMMKIDLEMMVLIIGTVMML